MWGSSTWHAEGMQQILIGQMNGCFLEFPSWSYGCICFCVFHPAFHHCTLFLMGHCCPSHVPLILHRRFPRTVSLASGGGKIKRQFVKLDSILSLKWQICSDPFKLTWLWVFTFLLVNRYLSELLKDKLRHILRVYLSKNQCESGSIQSSR